MIHLGIDTATDWLCLALHDPATNRDLGLREVLAERRHAVLLLPLLQELLAETGQELAAVSAIGVGTGPGSYTGLRVGIASAQGLASGLNALLSGGDSLEAAAWNRLEPGSSGWLTLDARRGNVYAGLYERGPDRVSCLEVPRKLPAADLYLLAEASDLQVLDAGPPAATWLARQAASGLPAVASYL